MSPFEDIESQLIQTELRISHFAHTTQPYCVRVINGESCLFAIKRMHHPEIEH